MQRIRPFHVGAVLLVATLLLLVLNAMEWPRPAPDVPSSLSLLRLVIGLPVVLFAPAFFVVPRLFRKDVGRPGASSELDLGWTLLAAVGLNIGFHAVHFNVLRVLGLPIRWPTLLAIVAVECAVGLSLLRRWHPDLRFGAWEVGLRRAFLAVVVLLVGFTVWAAPHLLRDGSWYFFHESVLTGWSATSDPDSVSIAWHDGPLEDGVAVHSDERVMSLSVASSSVAHQTVPIVLAVHAPVGSTVSLLLGDEILGREVIANMAPVGFAGPLVERYWEWGTAAMVARLQAPPQGAGRGRRGRLEQALIRPVPGCAGQGRASPHAPVPAAQRHRERALGRRSGRGLCAGRSLARRQLDAASAARVDLPLRASSGAALRPDGQRRPAAAPDPPGHRHRRAAGDP
jgi:hypothetical protein